MNAITQRFKSVLKINPIVVKEIRSRMRGARAFVTLTILLLIMGSVMYAMLQIILANSRYTTVLSPQVGQALFAALAFLELFMICAITPAVTSGAISSEKEKQTYEMLMATPLSPVSILWGKLISALSYIFLLIFAGIPLASVVFIFGGVALRDMAKALLVLMVVAVFLGVLGMFLSALFGRTGRATVASFIAVIILMIGPLFLTVLIAALRNGEPPRWLLAPSPISALSSALAPSMGQNSGGDLFYVLGGIFNSMGGSQFSQNGIPRPLYHYSLPLYILLTALLYLISTRLVQPTRRWRIKRKELLIGLGILLVMCSVFAGLYLLTAGRYEQVKGPGQMIDAMARPVMVAPPVPIIAEKRVVEAVPAPVQMMATPLPGLPPAVTATPGPGQQPFNVVEAPDTMALSDDAQAEIYAAVARQLFMIDTTFGKQSTGWETMYLVQTTDDSVGDPNQPKLNNATLSEPITSQVTGRLIDLKAKVFWVPSAADPVKDPKTSAVDSGKGVIITFGNIQPQPDGTVQVPASLFFANDGAAGKTYILQKKVGIWMIMGTTGNEWTS